MLSENRDTVCAEIMRVGDFERRSLVAVAGPPASGKSTLALEVVQALNKAMPQAHPFAAVLPMDGYHLDNETLIARKLLDRKGAPQTFDAAGFVRDLKTLRTTETEMRFPEFDRARDRSIPDAIRIHPKTPVVVVEGNYLLLSVAPWAELHELFSTTVFVSPPREVLKERLVRRWIAHGLDKEAALRRAQQNDLPNADCVLNNSLPADIYLE